MDRNKAKRIANNYVSMYRIRTKDLDTLINIIERDYKKQNYYNYEKICELATNSYLITSEKWFDANAEQNEKLLKDLTNMLLLLPRQSDDYWQLEISILGLVTRIGTLVSDL